MSDADDVVKSASKLFGKLGSTLQKAGGQVKDVAKQVSGVGRGDVRLELDQTRAAPGGTLRGRVTLVLPEPVAAKRLVVTLRARQRVVQVGKSSGPTLNEVYVFDAALRGEAQYESGEHPFELTVPPDAAELRPKTATGNAVADAMRAVASVVSPTAGPIEWQVVARLEIAWGRDLTKTVDVTIA